MGLFGKKESGKEKQKKDGFFSKVFRKKGKNTPDQAEESAAVQEPPSAGEKSEEERDIQERIKRMKENATEKVAKEANRRMMEEEARKKSAEREAVDAKARAANREMMEKERAQSYENLQEKRSDFQNKVDMVSDLYRTVEQTSKTVEESKRSHTDQHRHDMEIQGINMAAANEAYDSLQSSFYDLKQDRRSSYDMTMALLAKRKEAAEKNYEPASRHVQKYAPIRKRLERVAGKTIVQKMLSKIARTSDTSQAVRAAQAEQTAQTGQASQT
ncbi:MAG: hypothetical protein Q4C82_00960, partial [Eubacteriales bacterium]|nr:hypothetical protein [Eubacteriales bacterium]